MVRKLTKAQQLKKNKQVGHTFETTITQYFNLYMQKKEMKGIAYRFPDGRMCSQKIDILIDSVDLGLIGCECKRISDSTKKGGKIYFSSLAKKGADDALHQFIHQHDFLVASNRYGILCFRFNDLDKNIIVPHMLVYDKIIAGELFITVDEILNIGFDTSSNSSLKLFIKNKCRTK